MRAVASFVILTALAATLTAQDAPLAGNWKVHIVEDGQVINLWLVRLENKGGKWSGEAEPVENVPATTVNDVKVEGDLSPPEGTKPTLSFTLEHVDALEPNEEIKDMRYTVQFYGQDGKLLDLGRRFYSLKAVGKTLPSEGAQCVLEITGLEAVPGLAGSKPVLRLTQ